jgi:prevent-host-death family protein
VCTTCTRATRLTRSRSAALAGPVGAQPNRTYIRQYIGYHWEVVTTVGIRELARRASAIVRSVRDTGEPAIVTDRGRAVGVLYPIDGDALEDYVLANAPEFVTSMREADEDLVAGRTVSLDQLLATDSER